MGPQKIYYRNLKAKQYEPLFLCHLVEYNLKSIGTILVNDEILAHWSHGAEPNPSGEHKWKLEDLKWYSLLMGSLNNGEKSKSECERIHDIM